MKNKCKFCGRYEVRQKEVKIVKIFDDVEVAAFHMWKWCKVHNNWCKSIAGNCGEVVREKEKKLELDNIQGFKITMKYECNTVERLEKTSH